MFSPLDFRLNLQARLAEPAEPLTNLDNPAIRQLTWEHVVPDRPASSAPSAATTVPLPPPAQVPPPLPPPSASAFEPPPVDSCAPAPTQCRGVVRPEEDVVEEDLLEEVAIENDDCDDVVESALPVVEREINRLASVPDLIDDDSPIELPPITSSGGPYVAQQPSVLRPGSRRDPVCDTASPSRRTRPYRLWQRTSPQRRRRKEAQASSVPNLSDVGVVVRSVGRRGLRRQEVPVAPEQPTGRSISKPLATEVATARGLQFKTAVEVIELPIGDYAKRLAGSTVLRTATRPRRDVASPRAAQRRPRSRSDRAASAERLPGVLRSGHQDDLRQRRPQAVRAPLPVRDASGLGDGAARPAVRLELTGCHSLARCGAGHCGQPSTAMRWRWPTPLPTNDAPDQLAPEMFAFVQGHGNTVARRHSTRQPSPVVPGSRCGRRSRRWSTIRWRWQPWSRRHRPVMQRSTRRALRSPPSASRPRHAGDDVLVLRACQPDRRQPGVVRRSALDGRLDGRIHKLEHPVRRRQGRRRRCRRRCCPCSPRSSRGPPPLLRIDHNGCADRREPGRHPGLRSGCGPDGTAPCEGSRGLRWRRRRAGARAIGRQRCRSGEGRRCLSDHGGPPAWDRLDIACRRRAGPGRRLAVGVCDGQPRPGDWVRCRAERPVTSRGSSGTAAGCRGRRPSAWR